MSTHAQVPFYRCPRGSALITVIVFTTVLALLCGSFLAYAIHEKGINQRSRQLAQSRYLAESIVDYGFAQMTARFKAQTNLPSNEFSARALSVPRNVFLNDPAIDHDFTEIVSGLVPASSTLGLLDANDPSNAGDPLRGQYVFTREVEVFGRGAMRHPQTGARIASYASQRLQVRDAPLFAHAIFYNLDMELSPGAAMEVFGSVHSNRAIYVNTSHSLKFHDTVSTVAQFLHQRHPLSGQTSLSDSSAANVTIDRVSVSGVATELAIYANHEVYDSNMIDFADEADARWNRRLQTDAHNVHPQNPVSIQAPAAHDDPLTDWIDETNPGRALIEDAHLLTSSSTTEQREIESQRLVNQAGLRIVVDPRTGELTAYKRTINSYGKPVTDIEGNVVEYPVTLPADLVKTYSAPIMYDARRRAPPNATTPPASAPNDAIRLADIDVGKLKQVIEAPVAADPTKHIADFDVDANWNGIVYVEVSDTNLTGVRLVNGGQIPSQTTPNSSSPGMTLATNSPLYIQGHYNADGNISTSASTTSARYPDNAAEPPAALAADAITILSPSWNDANSGKPLANRKPTRVEISAAFLTGIVSSYKESNGTGRYSGGVENFPRFLEDWSGVNVAIRGSMVALFESEIANERWPGTGTVYNAPRRIWGYNERFKSGIYPPGTPNTRTYRRIHYRLLSAAEYENAVASLRPTTVAP